MSQIYNKMRIDVKEEITDIITAKQDDSNSRFLDVYLYDGATPIDLTGEEVRIYMRKPDGTEIFNNGTITEAASGRCQFELTDQALGAVGVLKCEISIWQGNTEILTTQTFHVFVAESLRSNGSIESSNEYGALVVLFQNLYQSIDLMQDMVANFGTPSGAVDADTFWQMLEYLYGVNEAALKNASVSEVLKRIGLNTDGEDAGTLFGAVNPLAGLIEDKINDVKNTVIEASGFKVPIKIIQEKVYNNHNFSGEGEGVLFVKSSSYSPTLTIDGVNVPFTTSNIDVDSQFAFKESFKFVGHASSSSSNGSTHVSAVFY